MSAFGRKPTLILLNFPSNACQLEAKINVLERTGLLTGKEVLDEMEVIAATKGKEVLDELEVIVATKGKERG